MLSSDAIFSAMALAEQFDANNVILKPLAGSPLHHLVESCYATPDMAIKLDSGEVSLDFFRLEQSANTKEGVFDKSRHDYAMQDFIQAGKTGVLNALNVARSGVAPRIAELLDLVTMRLSNAPVAELSKIKITEEEDCPALYGPNFRKLVDQFVNWPNAEPRLAINGPTLAPDEVLKLLETGIASIDEVLIPWAASLPEYQLITVYENFFTFKNGGDNRGFFERMDKSAMNMTLVFCIARNLSENDTVFEGSSLSLKDYREALKQIMGQAGHMLSIQMERNDAAIKNGTLVRAIVMNEIRVFPPVYREWLAQGGNTDVLYGMAASGKQQFTVDAITANAAEYLNSWRITSNILTSRDSTARFTYLRDQLILSYESILAKPNEAGETRTPQNIKMEMDCFKQVLSTMTIKDTEDLHVMCLRLVCRTSFSNTPAELILGKMDEEAKRNPALTPREAGAIATLWYISAWVASLIVPGNP